MGNGRGLGGERQKCTWASGNASGRQPDKHAEGGVENLHSQTPAGSQRRGQGRAGQKRGMPSASQAVCESVSQSVGKSVRTILIQHFHTSPPGQERLNHLLQTATSSQVERPTIGGG